MRLPPLRIALLSALLSILPALSARSAEEWSLETDDLHSQYASELKSIDAAGVHLLIDGNERVVPMDHFVELSRSVPPTPLAGKFALHLAGGDRIGGEPVAIKGERLVWKTQAVGDIDVPLRTITGLSAPDAVLPNERQKEDFVKLANGDSAHGSVLDLTGGKISIQTDAGAVDLPLSSVAWVMFAASPSAGRDKPGFRVRLDDGSSLLGSAITAGSGQLSLTLAGEKSPRPIDLAHVAAIEQVNGPVSWLSSRAPSESVYIPFLPRKDAWFAHMNANYEGLPIRFRDRVYARGIGVHSYSRLVFPLDGKTYRVFRTQYAIDPDATGGKADITVRILLDDKVAYTREHFQAGELASPVVIDLDGARKLTLEVDYGANIDAEDHFNWIEPALLKEKPAETATAPAQPATAPAQPATAPAHPATAQSAAPAAH